MARAGPAAWDCVASSPIRYGFDVYTHTEVVPRPPPVTTRWRVGPVRAKTIVPAPQGFTLTADRQEITVQLTADQQVALSITGQDDYGNPVDITGDVVWLSSDETIVRVDQEDAQHATAVAVGPVGTAAVTVTNDVNQDGTGDFQGSLAIDVVAGDITEIAIIPGDPTDKP